MSDNKPHPLREEEILTSAKAESEVPANTSTTPLVGRTCWDVVCGAARALKRPAVAIPVSLGVILLMGSGLVRVAYGKDGWVIEFGRPAERTKLSTLIAKGRELKKPYVVVAVSARIRIKDDVPHGERHAEWRITYTVHALRQIKVTDKVFKETYNASGAKTDHWFSTEEMSCTTDGNRDVLFELAEGETRTFVTGATNIYKLPSEDSRPAFGQRIWLTPDQLFLSYENESDVIGELTITVEPDSLEVGPVGRAAKRSYADGSVVSEELQSNPAGCRRSFTARWKNLVPQEEVGMHLRVGRQ